MSSSQVEAAFRKIFQENLGLYSVFQTKISEVEEEPIGMDAVFVFAVVFSIHHDLLCLLAGPGSRVGSSDPHNKKEMIFEAEVCCAMKKI